MRFAPPAVIALLDSGDPFAIVDCYKYTLVDGTVLRFTNGQTNVRYQPNNEMIPSTYLAKGIIIDGVRMHSQRGLSVDEQELSISAAPDLMVNGQPFMVAVRLGFFDGATLQRDRVYFSSWESPPVGAITLFTGRISSVQPGGGTKVSQKVKSEVVMLKVEMPRNKFATPCKHSLYDAGCGLDKDDFAVVGTVEAGSTRQVVNWSSATAGDFDLGFMIFETGDNVGVQRSIRTSTGSALIMVFPLDYVPNIGDQFKAYPGCDLTMTRCSTRFSNLDNFRGFPFLPVSETGL